MVQSWEKERVLMADFTGFQVVDFVVRMAFVRLVLTLIMGVMDNFVYVTLQTLFFRW